MYARVQPGCAACRTRGKFQKSSLARTARHLHACEGQSIEQHRRKRCKECGGASICPPRRVRSVCRECGGRGLCQHQRVRSRCTECGGGSICDHQRTRSDCRECAGQASASTSAGGAAARSAGAGACASTSARGASARQCREDAAESMPDGLEELGESDLGGRDAIRAGGITKLRRDS